MVRPKKTSISVYVKDDRVILETLTGARSGKLVLILTPIEQQL
jgi:hypothetical protein